MKGNANLLAKNISDYRRLQSQQASEEALNARQENMVNNPDQLFRPGVEPNPFESLKPAQPTALTGQALEDQVSTGQVNRNYDARLNDRFNRIDNATSPSEVDQSYNFV